MRWILSVMAMLSIAAAVLSVAGCESQDAQEFQAQSTGFAEVVALPGDSDGDAVAAAAYATDRSDPADTTDLFDAEITFCRKIGKKSGKRIGVAQRFEAAEKRYVQGLVDFRNVRPQRLYAVHLVWIKPDGKEMFRRYAEVVTEPHGDGYEIVIHWKKAEDLDYLKEERRESAAAGFTLASRLNISHSRQRLPGDYLLRVYLDRRLLTEKVFTLAEG